MIASDLRFMMSGNRTVMDRVTESLLKEYSTEYGFSSMDEAKQFDRFASFAVIQRYCPESFDAEETITAGGNDTGIDAIALIVNGRLIRDADELKDFLEKPGHVDATFVFVQAERSPDFDGMKMASFAFGVQDFFKEKPGLLRNAEITSAAKMMTALYEESSRFRPGNPNCRLFFVTTGKWQGDANLEARRAQAMVDLETTGLFRTVDFTPVGATNLQQLYRRTKNAIAREFSFVHKAVIPDMPGVSQAFLGFLPAAEFVKIITDESGEVNSALFYDNVRDWLGENPVNESMRTTLLSEAKSRFVLMNNGITIIARALKVTGNKFWIEDFTVVNGCQTSHVLYDVSGDLDESVFVPIRLIATQDEAVINDIIRATNRQTAVTPEQFYALEEFPKQLEAFFAAYDQPHRLYYERRSQQYHRLSIEKTRVVTTSNLIKAYAAMFLNEPHRTTKNYAGLKEKVGNEIFRQGQIIDPYYVAAYSLYKLEYAFRNQKLAARYKAARFHILFVLRRLANRDTLPRDNANEMKRYCQKIVDVLWDQNKVEALISTAASIIDTAAGGNFDRDNIRTEPFTKAVLAATDFFIQNGG